MSTTLIERARARLRLRAPALLGAGVVTAVAWPLTSLGIPAGTDGSWMAGLHMAVHDRLAFGTDVVFSYGPLGFLAAPRLYYPATGLLAMAVDLAVAMALAYTLIRLLNRALGIVASVAVTAVALMILNPLLLGGAPLLPNACLLVAALWSFDRVLAETPLRWAEVVGSAVLATIVLLIKLDAGVASIAVTGYAVVICAFLNGGAVAAVKRAAVFTGTIAVGLPVLWVAIGQPLGALPDWLGRSWEIAAGYEDAMGIEAPSSSWEYLAAALVVTVLVTGLVGTFADRARWSVLGFVALVSFVTFKQGFVRHDNHSLQFFIMFTLLPLVLLRRWGLRQVLLVAAVPAVCTVAVADVDVLDAMSPGRRIDGIADVSRLVFSSSERTELIDANRADLRASYDLPSEITDRVGDHSVAIHPSELAIAWAYPEIDQPAGDTMVVARFEGIGESTFDRLRGVAYKAGEFAIVVNDTSGFRFVTGHQGAPHVVGAPDCLGGALDGHEVPPIRTLEIRAVSGGRADAFAVEFSEVPYEC